MSRAERAAAPKPAQIPSGDRPTYPSAAGLTFGSDGAAIQRHEFAYRRSPDQDATTPARHPIVIVGAGPVGLTLAVDLAQRGQRVLLLDNDHRLSTGSRAICFAKRTLEIWDRLGVAEPMCARGVQWHVGRVYSGQREVYRFDLLPESGHERPAFINLQQYYAEAMLAVHAAELPALEIRWQNTVVACAPRADSVTLGVDTPEGRYEIEASHVIACDGSRSPLRALLGLETAGRVFRDRFLIADITMDAPPASFPVERRFWFDPPFHPGQSVLLHKQADAMWRVDFQLGWDADPELEKQHERIAPRVRALLDSIGAQQADFALVWASVYTFACQRMARFRHGRVIFAGDAAHGVSPFGARGANSGVQDADNLGWKLDAVQRGAAPEALLDSYAAEREAAADENILNSTRATDFITPKSEVSRLFRDAVLDLAREHPFARRLVNSGRLSVPSVLADSPLNTPDRDAFAGAMVPGASAVDAPVEGGWLLRRLAGKGFKLLAFDTDASALAALAAGAQNLAPGIAALDAIALPASGLAAERYDARPGTVYLLRPDQHVCARWRAPRAQDIAAALRRAHALT
jgi:3-(3-hydroxy-phenyl)propionate hydroxylase